MGEVEPDGDGEAAQQTNAGVMRDCWNYWKVLFALFYLVPFLLWLWWYWDSTFYAFRMGAFLSVPFRLWGCFAFSCAGFALLALLSTKTHEGDLNFPWSYIYLYPFICVFSALAVFVVCQMNPQLRGYLFNFSAYPLAFLAGLFSEHTLPALYKKLHG